MMAEQITQRLGLAAPVSNVTLNNNAANTGGVDMGWFKRAFFLLETGTITAGGSLNCQLQEANNANFNDATNLAGNNVAINAINTNNAQYSWEVRADQLTKRYVRLQVTETAAHNSAVTVVAFGDEAGHKPGSAKNDTSVAAQNVVSLS
jgi:hypothetical protein